MAQERVKWSPSPICGHKGKESGPEKGDSHSLSDFSNRTRPEYFCLLVVYCSPGLGFGRLYTQSWTDGRRWDRTCLVFSEVFEQFFLTFSMYAKLC